MNSMIGKLKSRHLITTERKPDHPGFRVSGSAYRDENQNFYTVHLRCLPGLTYYLVKNWYDVPEYLLFSRKAKMDEGKVRFYHRVGSGFQRINENVIEFHLPDLQQVLYLQLDPIDLHFFENSQRAA